MKRTCRAVVMAGALALCLVVLVGIPGKATAAVLGAGDIILPNAFNPLDPIGPLNPGFNFGNPVVGGDVFSFDSVGNVSFGGVGPRPLPRGQLGFAFLGGSDISFGGVSPRPLPRGDVPGGTALVFDPSGVISIGGVNPRPNPPRDEAYFIGLPVELAGFLVILPGTGDTNPYVPSDGDQVYIFASPYDFIGGIASGTENWTIATERIFLGGEFGPYPMNYLYAEYQAPAPVPEPSTMLLLGSGLVGLAGSGIRRLRKTGSKKS